MKKLYKGAFQPYLETAFYEEISRLRRHPLDEALVLVPSSLLAQRLRRELTQQLGGVSGVNIIDIENIWKPHVFKAISSRKLKTLSSRAAIICLKRAAERVLKPDDRLYPMLKFRGLPQALWNTIRDLKEARITYSDLDFASGKLPDPEKIRAIARVWKDFEETKNNGGFCDSKDSWHHALEDLKAAPPLLDAPFFIYGVYDVTHLQRELIRAYLTRNDAFALVPWYKQQNDFVAPFLEFLHSEGFQEDENKKVIASLTPLAELSERMFNCETFDKPIDCSSEIELFTAGGKYEEARETIRRLLKWCKERNIPFDEVGVILRNGESYRPLFREVMERAGLPYHTTQGEPLSCTPGGRSLSALVNLIVPNQRTQRAVAEFIEGATLQKKDGSFPSTPSVWMRLARKAGINDWSKDWAKKLAAFSEQLKREAAEDERDSEPTESSAHLADIENISFLTKYINGIFRLLDDIPRVGSWQIIGEKIKAVYQDYIDCGAWGASEAIAMLDDLIGMSDALGKGDIEEFLRAVNDELAERTITSSGESAHGITIADVMHARAAPFRAVAIPGLYHGGFPAPFREDPLLLDDERVKMGEILKQRYKPDLKGRRALEERFLFHLAIGSARERLVLSYPYKDAVSEKACFPSSIFTEVTEALGYGPSNKSYEFSDALDESEALLMMAKQSPELVADMPLLKQGRQALKKRNSTRLSVFDGIITDKAVLEKLIERFKKPEGWLISPSRMERYAACPFRFLMEYALDAEPIEEIEEKEEIEALKLGILYHSILLKFYRRMRDEGKLPFSPEKVDEYIEAMKETADTEFEQRAQDGEAVGRPLMWKFTKRQIIEDIEKVIIEDSQNQEWTPSFFEVAIGSKYSGEDYDTKLGSKIPISVELDENTRILVRGRIDRIDLSRDKQKARIVDYKTGSDAGYANNKLKGGVRIQVPIYCRLAEKLFEDQNIDISQGCYWFINRKKGAKQVEFTESGEKVKEALSQIIRCMEEGLFHQYADKGTRDCRRSCEFSRACFERPGDIKSRKKDDPLLETWNKLKEME